MEMVDADSEKKAPTPHTSGSMTVFSGSLSFQIEEANLYVL